MKKEIFLEYVEQFLSKTNMSPTTFGTLALKQPNFVFLLRKGREAREKTQNKVITFIQKYEEK